MQSEHTWLNMNHGIYDEPKVSSVEGKKQVAIAALRHIEGSKKIIEDHFYRGTLKIPYSFPSKPHVNMQMPHIIGEGAQYM